MSVFNERLLHLPFVNNPLVKFAHSKDCALKVYNQQIKKSSLNKVDKKDVIESEEKLPRLGYIDCARNLKPKQQLMLQNSEVQNFIPWRAVQNENSVRPPCRRVFDALQPTFSEWRLNEILEKKKINMSKLVDTVISCLIHRVVPYPYGHQENVQLGEVTRRGLVT